MSLLYLIYSYNKNKQRKTQQLGFTKTACSLTIKVKVRPVIASLSHTFWLIGTDASARPILKTLPEGQLNRKTHIVGLNLFWETQLRPFNNFKPFLISFFINFTALVQISCPWVIYFFFLNTTPRWLVAFIHTYELSLGYCNQQLLMRCRFFPPDLNNWSLEKEKADRSASLLEEMEVSVLPIVQYALQCSCEMNKLALLTTTNNGIN